MEEGKQDGTGTQGIEGIPGSKEAHVEKTIDLELGGDAQALERGGIVVARGTGDGLVLRLDGRVDSETLLRALRDYISHRRGFLGGCECTLEWVGQRPGQERVDEVIALLSDEFEIVVGDSRLKPPSVPAPAVETKKPEKERPLSLFDGIEALGLDDTIEEGAHSSSRSIAEEQLLFDEPDARVIYATLRSGQKVETDHTLIVCGDVNSGAEIVAGGDVVVLGTLRGVAHAGAYDETGGGRVIFALNMAPTQLRIGMVISRGESTGQGLPEVARVDGNIIVVEPYQSRISLKRG